MYSNMLDVIGVVEWGVSMGSEYKVFFVASPGGGANNCCVCKHTTARGVWRHAPPGNVGNVLK